MLHALGFTYSELIPLHRWLGVGIVFWSVVHTVGYLMYYVYKDSVANLINFYDVGRSTMNITGCFALVRFPVQTYIDMANAHSTLSGGNRALN